MNHGLSDRQLVVLQQILSLYAEEITSVESVRFAGLRRLSSQFGR